MHTAASWARLHGFNADTVRRVLKLDSAGYRGESRRVAIKLGLICEEEEECTNDSQ